MASFGVSHFRRKRCASTIMKAASIVHNTIGSADLVGKWESVEFVGSSARDFSSETFVFHSDSRFEARTTFSDGTTAQLNGLYRIGGRNILFEDKDSYTPSAEFLLCDDTLIIKQRFDIGGVHVILRRVD